MQAISTIGRLLTRARRPVRSFLVVAGALGACVSAGCLRSTMLRPADGSVPQTTPSSESKRGGPPVTPPVASERSGRESSPVPAGAAAVPAETTLPVATPSSPASIEQPSGVVPVSLQPAPDASAIRPAPAAPTLAEPAIVPTPAANAATPLLDAAIERVAAVTGEDAPADSGPADSQSSDASSHEHPQAPAAVAPPGQPAEGPNPAEPPETEAKVGPALVRPDPPAHTTEVAPVPKPEPPAAVLANRPKADHGSTADSALAPPRSLTDGHERAYSPIDVTRPEPPRIEAEQLGIAKLCLCRKVLGFGSYEALADTRVKAGQRLLVYCELTGMQYEEKHSEFVSRLLSRIEITSMATGSVVWVHELGPAEDVCGSRRHDFYVNYRVDVPATLSAGMYNLRLTQNDLVGERSISAEIPIEIVR